MAKRLTERMVEKAKTPEAGQAFLWDSKAPGLGLRVTAGGARSWVWEGRVKGRTRRITIGRFPTVPLPQARRTALDVGARVARGEDPAADRAAERRAITFGALAERYMADHARRHKRPASADQDERMLRDVLPRRDGARGLGPAPVPSSWRARRLGDIARDDVRRLHARLGDERGRYVANRTLALLRKMFNCARAWDAFAGDNPAQMVRLYRESKRDRFLSPDELRRVLAEVDAEPDGRWRAYFKLSLLLGPRKGELLQAKREHFDLGERTWRLPETKAGRPHRLPLPTPAAAIVGSLLAAAPGSPWLFPSGASASGHLEEPKAAWRRVRARAGVPDVRIHDLRRTLGSWLAAEGHSLVLIGAALNHTQPATTAVYARMALDPVRKALERNAALMLGEGRADAREPAP